MRNTPGPPVWDCSGQVVQLKSNLIPIMAQAIPALDQGCKNGIASFSPSRARHQCPLTPRLFHPTGSLGRETWSKLPTSVFGGECWWQVGTETSPAPCGCAALLCLPKMQVSLAPRLCQSLFGSWALVQQHGGKIQPLNPTACLFVVSWLALCKYLYAAEPDVIAHSSAMGVCDEPASTSMCAVDNLGAFVLSGSGISHCISFVSGFCLSPTLPSVHGAVPKISENI